MNINKLFFICLAAILSFVACDDMDSPETTQPVVDYALYNPLDGTSYVLDERNSEGAFETFLWGVSTIADEVTYSVEFSTDDFLTSSSLSAGTTAAYKASIGDMIPVFRAINVPANVSTEVQVRVLASANELNDTTASVTLSVKRYGLPDELWYIQGSATADELIMLDYSDEVEEYAYSVTQDLVVGEFNLIDTDGNIVGQSTLETGLVVDGTGITVDADGDYIYTFDFDLMKYTKNQNETWFAVGSATGGEMVELSYEGTQWVGRTDFIVGSYIFVEKYGSVYGQTTTADSTIVMDGDSIVAEEGSFNLTLDIPNLYYMAEMASYPENLYIIGEGIGGWDWSGDYIVDMIPVDAGDEDPSTFWAIAYLEGGKEFKFSPVKDWDGDFGTGDAVNDGALGVKTTGGDNIVAPATSGYYMVVVNLASDEILLTDADVYVMGATVGNWNSNIDSTKFTIDNTTKEFTYSYDFTSDELRLYASAMWEGEEWLGDWWRSEFIFFDEGVIEYRGADGDQTRHVIDAGDQTITLNFNSGAASIVAN